MMSNFDFAKLIEETKALEASSRPKLDESGTYTVKAVAASYDKNQAGTGFRGMIKVEVVDGPKATALKNLYLTEGKENAQSASNIKPYFDTLVNLGVKKDKLTEDCETWQEVIQSVIGQVTKQIARNVPVLFTLVLKENEKKSTPERKEFWSNVYSIKPETNSDVVSVDSTPTKPAKKKKDEVAVVAETIVTTENNDEDAWLD